MMPVAFITAFTRAGNVGSTTKGHRLGHNVCTKGQRLRYQVGLPAKRRDLSPQYLTCLSSRKVDGDGTEYITLESYIKVQGISDTGGQAKILIKDGTVHVNGETEVRRGRKLREGDVVDVEGREMVVQFE